MIEPSGSDPVAERARISPDATALVRAGDGRSWSFADLDRAVERTAGRLAAAGIEAGDHLGVLAENRPAVPHVLFAAFRLGAVAVPLNVRLAPRELADRIERTDLGALVCTAETAVDATDAAASVDRSLPVLSVDDASADARALEKFEPASVDPVAATREIRRLLLCTSGTTGDPKPVVLTAGNLRSSAAASALRLGVVPDDRWFVPLPLYHMGGFAPVFRSTLYGTTTVLQAGFDADRTLAAIGERDATCLSVVPTMLQRLLDAPPTGDSTLSDLRFVLSGGAATPQDLVDRCADRDVSLYPTYGTTETASQIATATPEEARDHPGTVGRPLFGTGVDVVDPEDETVLPTGERGELLVSGPTISPGYYGAPDATDAAFSEAGYHTGDLGYRDDAGRLWVVGRVDDLIVTGGENVHPSEVEEVLREHEQVRDAAVRGLDDDEWGQRVAAVVAADGLDPANVRAHCEGHIAGYKHPRTVAVVDDLPRTASGTVDRDEARRLLAERGVDV